MLGLYLFQRKVEGVKVDAQIVNINRESTGFSDDGTEDYEYHVYVNYTDKDGNEHFNIETNKYNSSMKVGDIIEVEYNPNNPDEILNQSIVVDIIFLVVGIACVAISIMKIISIIKNKNINEYNKVDMSNVSPSQIESIKNNTEEEKEYHLHFTGKLNQSYIMETPDRKPIYEARCDKVGIINKSEFTFINHLTGKETKHLVGHTTETQYNGFITNSDAKIDNVSVWDILGKEGYSLEPHIEGVKPSFDVLHYGVVVAKIEPAGNNILKDGNGSLLGEIPGIGIFKVYCKASDIEMVFLSAFVLSKVKFY